MNKLVRASRKLAFDEQRKTTMPLEPHIVLSAEKGVELAKKLKANVAVVESGTYLMDCLIGEAIKEGRLQDHIEMSLDRTNKLLKTLDICKKELEPQYRIIKNYLKYVK